MLRTVLTFLPVAGLLTITPGPATAMVVRSAVRGGRREALLTTVGNSIAVLTWACLAAVGVAAAVAASATVFAVVKLAGAAFLVAIGVRTLRGRRPALHDDGASAIRGGLVSGIANPKLGAFYVALFPQFVPHGQPVLATALLMASLIVAADLVYFSTLAYAVTRARRAFVEGAWLRRVERLTGAVLVGLGVRLALERP